MTYAMFPVRGPRRRQSRKWVDGSWVKLVTHSLLWSETHRPLYLHARDYLIKMTIERHVEITPHHIESSHPCCPWYSPNSMQIVIIIICSSSNIMRVSIVGLFPAYN